MAGPAVTGAPRVRGAVVVPVASPWEHAAPCGAAARPRAHPTVAPSSAGDPRRIATPNSRAPRLRDPAVGV